MKRLIGVLAFLLFQSTLFGQDVSRGEVNRTLVAKDSSDTVQLIFDYAFFGSEDDAYKKSVNDYIRKVTAEWLDKKEAKNTSLGKDYFQKILDGFAKGYEDGEDLGTSVWSFEQSLAINEFDTWVQLKHSGWEYSGGAHGNSFFVASVFDLEDGRALEIGDFIKDIDALNKLLEPIFRKEKGLSEDESLAEAGFEFEGNEFKIGNNFFFTGRSLSVYFNSYEIASYAAGPTELEISIDKIEHLMKRDF